MRLHTPSRKGAVSQSRDRRRETLPRFLLLAAVHISLSYGMISYPHLFRNLNVIEAKLAFAIQRDFVFTKKREPR